MSMKDLDLENDYFIYEKKNLSYVYKNLDIIFKCKINSRSFNVKLLKNYAIIYCVLSRNISFIERYNVSLVR